MSYKLVKQTDGIATLTVQNKLINVGEEFDATPEELAVAKRFFEVEEVKEASKEQDSEQKATEQPRGDSGQAETSNDDNNSPAVQAPKAKKI